MISQSKRTNECAAYPKERTYDLLELTKLVASLELTIFNLYLRIPYKYKHNAFVLIFENLLVTVVLSTIR